MTANSNCYSKRLQDKITEHYYFALFISAVKKRYSSGGRDEGSTGSLTDGQVIVMPGQPRPDSAELDNLLSADSANAGRVSSTLYN